MKTLLYFDENAFEKTIVAYEANILALQKVVEMYNSMQLSPLINEEFCRLFINPTEVIFDKMTQGQEISIAGLKLHKDKAFDILHKPEGFEAFMQSIDVAKESLQDWTTHAAAVAPQSISNIYFLSDNGEVELLQSFKDKQTEISKTYATSDKAAKVLKLATFIVNKVEELGLNDVAKQNPNGFSRFVAEIIDGGAGKDLKVNVKGILEYNSK